MFFIFSDVEEHDKEGRVITAEFEDYYVVTACEYGVYISSSPRTIYIARMYFKGLFPSFYFESS